MCWHKWKVKEKEVLSSAMEQLAAAGLNNLEGIPSGIFNKPCIVTYFCAKCGAEKVERV